MRVHYLNLPRNAGLDQQQTLCELIVIPQRRSEDQKIERWLTIAGNMVQCDILDLTTVTCLRCRALYTKGKR